MVTRERSLAFSAIAALGSLVAALSCCLPVGAFLAAAGTAGAARILAPLRPWLLVLSVLFLAVGFVRANQHKDCSLRRDRFSRILLWAVAAVVAATLLFPQIIAGLIADKLPKGFVR